jgi:Apea-like HEPN
LVCGMGGGRTGRGVSGRWVLHCLLSGVGAETILAAARASVSANRYEALEVRPVKGVKIDAPYRLTQMASLVPNNQLVRGHGHARAFGNDMLGPQFPSDTAALIQKIVVEPAMIAIHSDQDQAAFERGQETRNAYAARLRLALGLASGKSVEMPLAYGQSDPESILGLSGEIISQRPSTTFFGSDIEVDIPAALRIFAQLEAMQAPRALELSVDRLLRSRSGRNLEDRIIDLGMAAEIALMHAPKGSGDGKSEITNKLSMRGAWLIGETARDRQEVATLLSELYAARSVVVHTGEASGKLQARMVVFDDIVVRIARALLRRGGFPDWKALVLGADAEHAPDLVADRLERSA